MTSDHQRNEQDTEIRPAADADHTVVTGADTERFPGYKVIEELGKGGMGVVYLAVKVVQVDGKEIEGHKVAIKTILTQRDTEYFRDKFLDEGQRQAISAHPHILPLFDIGQNENELYMVVQYAPQGNLGDLLQKGEVIEPARAAYIVECIAKALHHAHTKINVAHLDIKPDNILFLADEPVLADFGISRDVVDDTINATVVAATPKYSPPEQLLGKPHRHSDIYALAVTFYEMLTGKVPPDALKQVRSDADRDALVATLPAAARKYGPLIADCLRFEPEDRPSAAQLRDRLEELARPAVRSRLLPVAVAAALLAALLVAALSPAVQDWARDRWTELFPPPVHEVQFAVTPATAEVWVDGEKKNFRQTELAEGSHAVAVVADGYLGQYRALAVGPQGAALELALDYRPIPTDAEYLEFSRLFGVEDDKVQARSWVDGTLANLAKLERLQAEGGDSLEAFVEGLNVLAQAGDAVARTTLFYGAFEGLVPGERGDYLAGLQAASADGYALATVLEALDIIDALLASGKKFDEDMDSFATVTSLLKRARDQGMPKTAQTFAGIIGADITQ